MKKEVDLPLFTKDHLELLTNPAFIFGDVDDEGYCEVYLLTPIHPDDLKIMPAEVGYEGKLLVLVGFIKDKLAVEALVCSSSIQVAVEKILFEKCRPLTNKKGKGKGKGFQL